MANKLELLDELTAVRDEARVQWHLLSMEARERWHEFEGKLDSLEEEIGRGGEKTTDAILSKVQTVRQTISGFLSRHLQAPADISAPVRALMTRVVYQVSPQDPLDHVARTLWDSNCGAAPVVANDAAVIGMITDRDICMAAYTQGKPLSMLAVEGAMSMQVFVCSMDDSLERALEVMSMHRVRRLPVTNRKGHLVGVIALADIARWAHSLSVGRSSANDALASTLAAISEAPRPVEVSTFAAE